MKIPEVWHATVADVLLKAIRRGAVGLSFVNKFYEFMERKRIHDEFDITSGQIGGEFSWKQLRIRPCDIDIAVEVYAKWGDRLLPLTDFLDFIKEQIDSAGPFFGFGHDILVQSLCCTEVCQRHGFKIVGKDQIGRDTVILQFSLNDFQHDRLSAASNTGDDLYEILVHKRTDSFQI